MYPSRFLSSLTAYLDQKLVGYHGWEGTVPQTLETIQSGGRSPPLKDFETG
jgi:hypothetical protein